MTRAEFNRKRAVELLELESEQRLVLVRRAAATDECARLDLDAHLDEIARDVGYWEALEYDSADWESEYRYDQWKETRAQT